MKKYHFEVITKSDFFLETKQKLKEAKATVKEIYLEEHSIELQDEDIRLIKVGSEE